MPLNASVVAEPPRARPSRWDDLAFLPEGECVHEIAEGGLTYRLQLLHKGDGLPLIVSCPHLGSRAAGEFRFQRTAWLKGLPFNAVAFSDPTLLLDPKLKAGWGLGTAEEWPLARLAGALGRLRDALGIGNTHIVFVGAGAGAFMALVLASLMPGASALVSSPDLSMEDFRRPDLRRILAVGFGGADPAKAAAQAPERFSVRDAFAASAAPPPRICLQRSGAESEAVGEALTPFLKALARDPKAGEEEQSGRLLIDYYHARQSEDRPPSAFQLTRGLNLMAPWFVPGLDEAQPQLPSLPAAGPAPSAVRRAAPAHTPPDWDAILSGTHRDKALVAAVRARVAGEAPVPEAVVKALSRLDLARARILDVGVGPHSSIGPVLYGARLNITAVDPEAEANAERLQRAGLTPAIPTKKAESHALVAVLGRNRFDVVHMKDGLAGTAAPLEVLQAMIDTCVPGGVVVLDQPVDDGAAESAGPPWAVMPVDGDLVIWSRSAAVLARPALKDVSAIRTERDGPRFRAFISKML